MSERKLYEVGIRLVGVWAGVIGIGNLGIAIQATIRAGTSADASASAVSAGVVFLIFLVASAVLIAFGCQIATLLSKDESSSAPRIALQEQGVLRVGILLIGVYVAALGGAQLISTVVHILVEMGPAAEFGGMRFYSTTMWIHPLIRLFVGLGLIFHTRIIARFRGVGAVKEGDTDES